MKKDIFKFVLAMTLVLQLVFGMGNFNVFALAGYGLGSNLISNQSSLSEPLPTAQVVIGGGYSGGGGGAGNCGNT